MVEGNEAVVDEAEGRGSNGSPVAGLSAVVESREAVDLLAELSVARDLRDQAGLERDRKPPPFLPPDSATAVQSG